MTAQDDAKRLLETWREHFEAEGFGREQAERMSEVAVGPAVVREARGDEIDLTDAFREHFETQGETPQAAEAMGQIASGELRPGPQVSGDRIIQLVEA
jgi:hypothetical protein